MHSPFEKYLLSVARVWQPGFIHYMPPERAHEELKRYCNVDFGNDIAAWIDFGVKNDLFLSEHSKEYIIKFHRENGKVE